MTEVCPECGHLFRENGLDGIDLRRARDRVPPGEGHGNNAATIVTRRDETRDLLAGLGRASAR
jgi:hypothetical protein